MQRLTLTVSTIMAASLLFAASTKADDAIDLFDAYLSNANVVSSFDASFRVEYQASYHPSVERINKKPIQSTFHGRQILNKNEEELILVEQLIKLPDTIRLRSASPEKDNIIAGVRIVFAKDGVQKIYSLDQRRPLFEKKADFNSLMDFARIRAIPYSPIMGWDTTYSSAGVEKVRGELLTFGPSLVKRITPSEARIEFVRAATATDEKSIESWRIYTFDTDKLVPINIKYFTTAVGETPKVTNELRIVYDDFKGVRLPTQLHSQEWKIIDSVPMEINADIQINWNSINEKSRLPNESDLLDPDKLDEFLGIEKKK